MIAPFLRAFLLLVLTLVDAHLNFTSVIVANWTEVADGPSGREYHAMAPLSDGRLLMYGGNTQGKDGLFKCFNDTYIYTPSSFTLSNGKGVTAAGEGSWTKVADGPDGRYAHAMAPLSNERVLMYGGYDGGYPLPSGYLNDTWIIESPEVPSICCQTKSSDHKDDKAKCATFLDSKSCDDYSKGFGDFCIWKC